MAKVVKHEPELYLEVQAAQWMAEHPEAMDTLEVLARKASKGGKRFGIKFLVERLRWEFAVERKDNEFKLNNNYSAYIMRELIRRNPSLGPRVELRAIRAVA